MIDLIIFLRQRLLPSAPPEPTIKEQPIRERKEQTKNVSFKKHVEFPNEPNKPALEKDQLAKLPYGWHEVNGRKLVENYLDMLTIGLSKVHYWTLESS